MALTEKERLTRDLYNIQAPEWLARLGVEGRKGKDRPCFWSVEMRQILASLLGPAKDQLFLEIGCGPATDGKYLVQGGVKCISVDYSIGMLKLAKEIGIPQPLLQMDINNLGFSSNLFDGIWATACLLHLENANKALSELNRVCKRDSIGFISIKEGVGEAYHPKTGIYFHYYQNGEFAKLLHNNHFEVIQYDKRIWEQGHDYLTYIVRANK